MAPQPEISSDIHRDLGKIQATLDEILRRLDKHADNEEKMEAKIAKIEACFRVEQEKLITRISDIETKLHYALGVVASVMFIFEVVLKFVKV